MSFGQIDEQLSLIKNLEVDGRTNPEWKQLTDMASESLFDTFVTSSRQCGQFDRRSQGCENDCCKRVAQELDALKSEVQKIKRFLSEDKVGHIS